MFEFDATLWRHSGQAAWHFVTLPFDVSDDIEARQRRHIAFGSVRVEATVGASRWSTSLFPDKSAQAYLLPVKKAVRVAEGISDGDRIRVALSLIETGSDPKL